MNSKLHFMWIVWYGIFHSSYFIIMHGNVATKGNPKLGLCPTLIEWNHCTLQTFEQFRAGCIFMHKPPSQTSDPARVWTRYLWVPSHNRKEWAIDGPTLSITFTMFTMIFNPLTAKLFNMKFHPLEVVSRWRDPQLQVSENYSDLTKWRSTVFKYCWLMSHFIFNMFKRWHFMC